MTKESVKTSLYILGCYAFGSITAVFLHEVGYAAYIWASGGVVDRIVINPFSWSFTLVTDQGQVVEPWLSWSGSLFGVATGILIFGWVWRALNPYWNLLRMSGALSVLYGGMYLVRGDLPGSPSFIANSTTSLVFTVVAGLLLIMVGLCLSILGMPWNGIPLTGSIRKHIGLFTLSILPYACGSVIYSAIFNYTVVLLWFVIWCVTIINAVVIAAGGKLFYSRFQLFPPNEIVAPTWRQSIVVFALGTLVTIFSLLFLQGGVLV